MLSCHHKDMTGTCDPSEAQAVTKHFKYARLLPYCMCITGKVAKNQGPARINAEAHSSTSDDQDDEDDTEEAEEQEEVEPRAVRARQRRARCVGTPSL